MKKLQKLLITLHLFLAFDFCRGAEECIIFDESNFFMVTHGQDGDIIELSRKPEDIIFEEINAARRVLLDEPSFEKKSMIVAQIAARAGYLAGLCNIDIQQEVLKLVGESFELDNEILGSWQYKYEYIIGRTRTAEDPNWTDEEKRQVNLAKKAFDNLHRLSTNQDIHKALSEVDFDYLDDVTQQAFHQAVKQQLKIVDIKRACDHYLMTQDLKEFSSKKIAEEKKLRDEKEFYKKALKLKRAHYSQQSFKGFNPVLDNLPVPVARSISEGLEEID